MNDQQPYDFHDAPDSADMQESNAAQAGSLGGAEEVSLVNAASGMTSYTPVSEKSVSLDRLVGCIGMCVLMLIVICSTTPTFLIPQMPWWGIGAIVGGWAILAAVLLFFAQVHPRWVFERTRWALTQEGFEILRGIIWRHHIAIPAARVQHVDVSQGPLQRMYDLGKLTIHTAGTANASVELNGLEHSLALELRDELIRQKELLDDA